MTRPTPSSSTRRPSSRFSRTARSRKVERQAYRILRRGGETLGTVRAYFTPQSRITAMRGWSLPETGKAFEVKSRDIIETALTNVDGGELVTDLRRKVMTLPAAVPGNVIGYEIEKELQPYEMTDEWDFQDTIPVREGALHGALAGGMVVQRVLAQPSGDRSERNRAGAVAMAVHLCEAGEARGPDAAVAGNRRAHGVSLQPPGGQTADGKRGGFRSWQEVGCVVSRSHARPARPIAAASPESAGADGRRARRVEQDPRDRRLRAERHPLRRDRARARRCQPHPASEVFSHGYGDCKDKVTLLSSMLKEIGVESYYVLINTTTRVSHGDHTAELGFNHAVVAIQLPAGVDAAQLPARITHKSLGTLLFFDPTHPLDPVRLSARRAAGELRRARDGRGRRAGGAPADAERAQRRAANGETDARRERPAER